MLKKILSILGTILLLFAITIAGQIGRLIGNESSKPPTPTQQEIEKILLEGFTKAAEQANSRGPIMIDEDTRWDKSVAGPDARLTYFYSFPKYSSLDIDRNWLQANLFPEVKRGVCSNASMRSSLQNGGTYVYTYTGNDGIEIYRFELNKNNCE
jgi:hypothetical protein